jgi:hypothetical protein
MTQEEFYKDFMQNIYARAEAGSRFREPVFVELMCDFLVEQAVLEEPTLVSYKKETAGLKLDAWEYIADHGTLTLIVSEFREQMETLTQTAVEKIFKRATRFFEKSLNHQFYSSLEESDPAWSLANGICKLQESITKVRVIILTNALLSSRLQSLKESELKGFKCLFDIWDMDRLYRIETSGIGKESIVIDFEQEFGRSLQCLPAFIGSDTFQSYLLAIPGELMACLYGKYGERLLEQNVRTFLQFRGNVNKGMRNTIINEPRMFFAYNNGITATAEAIETDIENGNERIKLIKNLQIVNGGQTTASLYTALIKSQANLEHVYVQMKLTIVPSEQLEQVVPKISEYANTQNKINAADFFSNHPFHLRIEDFSRRLWAPSLEGGLKETHWYYERTRGQYANAQAGLTNTQRKGFLNQNPRTQMFSKTDLAKFHYSWEKQPHIVSLGAQKNFAKFASYISMEWVENENKFNELYFKELIAKAIMFRFLDRALMKQAWYGGYKANIIAYSIAKFSELITVTGKRLDLLLIWKRQQLTEITQKHLLGIARVVNDCIQDTPEGITNVTEWCKKIQCWINVQHIDYALDSEMLSELMDSTQQTPEQEGVKKVQKLIIVPEHRNIA